MKFEPRIIRFEPINSNFNVSKPFQRIIKKRPVARRVQHFLMPAEAKHTIITFLTAAKMLKKRQTSISIL
jgi:hypothetical protein